MLQYAIQQSILEQENGGQNMNPDEMTYEQLLALEEKNGKVCVGLNQEQIEKIPIANFNRKLKHFQDKCSICITEFNIGQQVKILDCKHFYHVECISSWLKDQKKCPVCKNEILI
ncbi:hypothetical protein IMG5_101120 [Ichthyophthirius multifiliis]|uniref:RING-type domain-containing protein n=1 Tax=Ichthyophthirius multifiliis TaxID=5932 RepID=G0QSH1_ICHMU|nr:hypothetical protein IMG5_101120 [Ichthyophthirius multifiliis]EGR31809.1 hypothetical protein IMG5_101120 [Ichthyophthirius multifiliis]|eukprot:XP_004035295.1 hypothetical protein IMG5_101120 [Ichthyophthirius multifiliis]